MIPDREALEAYNTIRKYCRERDCDICIFHGGGDAWNCAIDKDVPEKWQELALDQWSYKYNSGRVTLKDKK